MTPETKTMNKFSGERMRGAREPLGVSRIALIDRNS